MRFIEIGVGPDGRSTVTGIRAAPEAPPTGERPAAVDIMWSTRQWPPEVPVPRRSANEPAKDIGVAGRTSAFLTVQFAPRHRGDPHRTDTLDHFVVVAGSATLHLDDGEIVVGVGDAFVIPGVTHWWEAGEHGCTMMITLLGLPPVT